MDVLNIYEILKDKYYLSNKNYPAVPLFTVKHFSGCIYKMKYLIMYLVGDTIMINDERLYLVKLVPLLIHLLGVTDSAKKKLN